MADLSARCHGRRRSAGRSQLPTSVAPNVGSSAIGSSSRPRSRWRRSARPVAHQREILQRRELRRSRKQHGETDARWLDYEIDVAKLLDFPLMTDMRNPLTMAFHKARRPRGPAAAGETLTTSTATGTRSWNTATPSTTT